MSAATSSEAIGIGPQPAHPEHERAGDGRGDEGVEVGQDVLERALDVEARAVGARQRPDGRQVDPDADDGDHEHEAALDVGRLEQAPHGLERDHERQHEQRDAVDLRRQDLDALEAVGHDALRRPGGQADGDQRESDRRRVGEHVPGVREQRQRVAGDAGDDLEQHEAEDQHERDRELAAVGVGRDAVRVAVACRRRARGRSRGAHLRETDARHEHHSRRITRSGSPVTALPGICLRWTTSCNAAQPPSSIATCRRSPTASRRARAHRLRARAEWSATCSPPADAHRAHRGRHAADGDHRRRDRPAQHLRGTAPSTAASASSTRMPRPRLSLPDAHVDRPT